MTPTSITQRWLGAGKRALRRLVAVPPTPPAPFPVTRSGGASTSQQVPETTLVLSMLMLDGLATELYRAASSTRRPHDPQVDWAKKHDQDVRDVVADLKKVVGGATFDGARAHMRGEFDRPLGPATRPRKGLNLGPFQTTAKHSVDAGTLLAVGLILQGLADLVNERQPAGADARIAEFWQVIDSIEAAAGPIVTATRDRNSEWKTALEYVL